MGVDLGAGWHSPAAMPRRWLAGVFGVSAVFAALVAIFSSDSVHQLWGAMAACGYGLAVAAVLGWRKRGADLALGLSFCGALLLPLAHGSIFLCAAFLTASQLCDMGWVVYNVGETTARQSIVPDRLLGRVNSAMHLLFRGIYPAGAFVAGVVAQYAGVRTTILAGAIGVLCSNGFLFFIPRRLAEQAGALETLGDRS